MSLDYGGFGIDSKLGIDVMRLDDTVVSSVN